MNFLCFTLISRGTCVALEKSSAPASADRDTRYKGIRADYQARTTVFDTPITVFVVGSLLRRAAARRFNFVPRALPSRINGLKSVLILSSSTYTFVSSELADLR